MGRTIAIWRLWWCNMLPWSYLKYTVKTCTHMCGKRIASTSYTLSELFNEVTDEPLMAPVGAYDPQHLVSEHCSGVYAQHDRPSTA